jgi:3',5'-cyclic AMP phosphodiesterase CpdA
VNPWVDASVREKQILSENHRMRSRVTRAVVLSLILMGSFFPSFFCAIVPAAAQQEPVSFLIGPYTQHALEGSIIVVWKTSRPAFDNEVHWGCTPQLGNITVEHGILPHVLHRITVTGLTEGTQYYYAVASDGIESPLGVFFTTRDTGMIRFVVYGDSRGSWDDWDNTSLVAQAITRTHPEFVLHTGDLVDNGRISSEWVDFFNASEFTRNSTLYPVLGNHERYGSWYFRYFSLPSFNERWYSFDDGPVHVIGLDSNPLDVARPIQLLWLVHDLRVNTKPFTVVFFHHPVFSSGNHGNSTVLQVLWKPVFDRFHVSIVFSGHDHDYERIVVDGITYVVTGGGGAPLYDVGHSPWTVISEKTYHFCLVDVNATSMIVQAMKTDGSVFDSFII